MTSKSDKRSKKPSLTKKSHFDLKMSKRIFGRRVRVNPSSYDSEGNVVEPIMKHADAEATINQMGPALKSALVAVERANNKVLETLSALDDPDQQRMIINEVEQEIADNPGWLDEMAEIMSVQEEDIA